MVILLFLFCFYLFISINLENYYCNTKKTFRCLKTNTYFFLFLIFYFLEDNNVSLSKEFYTRIRTNALCYNKLYSIRKKHLRLKRFIRVSTSFWKKVFFFFFIGQSHSPNWFRKKKSPIPPNYIHSCLIIIIIPCNYDDEARDIVSCSHYHLSAHFTQYVNTCVC